MICPVCKEQGKESFVYPGMSSTTLMYCQPYYDPKGVYHDHDYNIISTSYTCSERHAWGISGHGSCPARGCDFGNEEHKITIYDNDPTPISGSISYNNIQGNATKTT